MQAKVLYNSNAASHFHVNQKQFNNYFTSSKFLVKAKLQFFLQRQPWWCQGETVTLKTNSWSFYFDRQRWASYYDKLSLLKDTKSGLFHRNRLSGYLQTCIFKCVLLFMPRKAGLLMTLKRQNSTNTIISSRFTFNKLFQTLSI